MLESRRDKSGIGYVRNRYYDPATGRFTQEDPIGLAAGLNLYGFAGGDPVNFSDPFGLSADTLKRVQARHLSGEEPPLATRALCMDQNVAGSAQAVFDDLRM